MAARAFKNFVKVTVSTTYTAAATSIVLTSGHGAECPPAPFLMVWWNSTDYADPSDDPNVEIVLVTARSTDTLTVIRGVDNTTASTKNTAAKVYLMANVLTAQDVRRDSGRGMARSVPPLSAYVRSLEVTNNPDWTPVGGISSITYNARRNTLLFADQISGAAGNIYETNLEGRLLRTITNSNYVDTEGIAWMYDDVYAIAEEDVGGTTPSRITIAVIADGATTNNRVAAGNVTYELTTPGDLNNLGCEGVTYDPDRNLLYYVYEKSSLGTSTTGVWNIWTLDPVTGQLGILCDILQTLGIPAVVTDLSDIYYDRNSQTIYMVSHESEKVVRIDMAGNLIEQLALAVAFTQVEGICFTPNMGTMFINGEADEFSRYEAQTTVLSDPSKEEKVITWVIATPAVGGVRGPRISHDWIPLRMDAHVAAATSVTFNIEERTAPGTGGTNIIASDLVATTTGAAHTTSFSNDLLAIGNWLHVDISAVSGTPGQVAISLVVRPR